MQKWEYDLTTDVLAEAAKDAPSAATDGQVVLCDPEGRCFFHDRQDAEIDALRSLLNRRGAEGWELVQFDGHDGVIHGVWKRSLS